MKVIIDIDDEMLCNDIKSKALEPTSATDEIIINALYNGIPYEERPQGEWKVYGKQGGVPITDKCTNCKYEMMWYKNKYNFCPNCGAQMKKGGAE